MGTKGRQRLADVSRRFVLRDGERGDLTKLFESVNGGVAVVPPSYHERPILGAGLIAAGIGVLVFTAGDACAVHIGC